MEQPHNLNIGMSGEYKLAVNEALRSLWIQRIELSKA